MYNQRRSISKPYWCVVKDFGVSEQQPPVTTEPLAVCNEPNQVCENYQGYYGEAFRLQFPNYDGSVYVASIDQLEPRNCFARTDSNANPIVIAGSINSPYFHVMNRQ